MKKESYRNSKNRFQRGASNLEAPLFVDDSPQNKKFYIAFGARIREKRLNLQLSQIDLAEMASIDRSYLAGIEAGKRSLSLRIAYKLAKCLGTSLDLLLIDINY